MYLQLIDEHRNGVELIVLILTLHHEYVCVLGGVEQRDE